MIGDRKHKDEFTNLDGLGSCATGFLTGVGYHDPLSLLHRMPIPPNAYTFVVFCDNNRRFFKDREENPKELNHGQGFADYIEKHGLGKLWASDWLHNDYFGHERDFEGRKVRTWIWNPDYKAISKHLKNSKEKTNDAA